MAAKIRTLVVDDSILARKVIMDGLNRFPGIEVVGFAVNAIDAKTKVRQLKPDVMTLDVQMPGMTGLDFLKQLLPEYPLPVVLVSALNLGVFDALHAGAVDFVRKPDNDFTTDMFIRTLAGKVRDASRAKVKVPGKAASANLGGGPANLGSAVAGRVVIGLGASTGGTEATLEVMRRLPEDIPGMVVVQHMPVGFTQMYAERLNKLCRMEVREAKDGDEVKRGLALIAPADLQTRILRSPLGGYRVSCTKGPRVSGHRPSVDALFHSMADNVRCNMVGIIMTGMGRDGAMGLKAMRDKGAFTIGQDEDSCVVYGMPRAAYEIGAVSQQAACKDIANVLVSRLRGMRA